MRKNLSQQKLLEILTSEIETLKQTTENINEIAPEIDRQLHALKTTKLKYDINTDKLEQLLEDHKRKLEKSVVIPRWFLWLIAAIMIWFIFQILFKFI
ncbi:hypothetical protein SLH46_21070 [Draconibacterium sp. IB214405]|uniref:hypothetical protein n=1 Tax=Draconibacterium sp. IB214405 TaxID=3097352 RepID=UPI002A13BBFB|nr:hypothetical protein [Draconibacterium sp. IB214405]MDX8341704.1 hypothetical protein [Draconibacterium sp. IB214405]